MTGRLAVRLQPRAGRTEVVGERDGAVVIRVTAPALEGRANAALCAFIASATGVGRGAVRVVHGEKGRDKLVEVEGRDTAELRRALGLES